MDKYGINCVKDSTSTLGGIDSLPNGNKYKKQMGAIEAIGACASDSEVEITLGAEGLLDDGEIWGVSWRPEAPQLSKIKSSIDINGFPEERSRSDDDKFYRRLEGKWYLFKKH